jgi:hypothetical protein
MEQKKEGNSQNSIPNYSAEEKTTRNSLLWNKKIRKQLGISFRTIPRKRKQLGNPFHGTKIGANSQNSVPKHFAGA